MRDKGLGVAISLGIIVFVLVYAITDGFASPDQELVASSDVVVRAAAPTVNDDIDFNILKGVIWVDTAGGAVYINEDNTDGAAVWTDITAGGSTFNAEEGDSVVTANASVIDFGAGFDLTDSPAGEANVVLDYTEDPVDLSGSEVTGTLDLSDHVNLSAGTGATLTGDSLSVDLGTAIDSSEITDGTISEADLKAVDTAADEECLTYESTIGDFEWQVCASGGTGTVTTIAQDGTPIGDPDIVTLDFGDGFTCSESPDTEVNCTVDLGEAIDTSEITDGTILEADLKVVDTANDEECLTYEATGGDFEWQVCSSGSGTLTTVKQDGVQVGDSDIVTIDFGDGLTCTESPDTEINCVVDLGEAIDTSEITDGTILEADLAAVDTANDEECLTYEATGGDFEWQVCSSGSGTVTTIKQDGVQVGDSDIVTIDFGDGLTCTESPDTEINCVVDLGESISLTAEVSGTLPVANGGTGQTSATNHGVMVANGATFVIKVIPDCNAAGEALLYDQATSAFSCASGYLTTVDISDNTNLTAGSNITLTGDQLDVDDAFLLNTGDVGTGAYDFGGATSVEIPNGAGGTTVNAAGEITLDTTSDTINFYDGSVEQVLQPKRRFSITVESPGSSEDISIFRTDFAITVTRETCVLVGSSTPSVTVTLRHGTDRSAAGNELNTSGNAITSTTTGDEDTTFNDATVAADSFLWLETTAQSGTVESLSCTWEYRVDA